MVTYNAHKLPLDLPVHPEGVASTLRGEEVKVCFLYELMNETGKLEQKCKQWAM
jgi:hypothetical protein